MSAEAVRIERLPADFDRWQDLLDLILGAFAYMDGVIDPPSSAHRLTVEGLRGKAREETCFVAMNVSPLQLFTPSPNPSPQEGGGVDRAAPHTSGSAEVAAESPSPLRGGVRGGGNPAVDQVQILGCVFIAERSDHFYVGKLAVASGMQGTGIGKALMRAAEDLARGRGKPVLELQTRVELTGNHAAFARLGFRETARTAHEGYDRPTSLTMRKVLA